MKKSTLLICTLVTLLVAACGSGPAESSQKEFPAPGTVVDSMAMPILIDSLNDFSFSVSVIADSNIKSGIYDVHAAYGHNEATGLFTMPKGAEHYKPVIRKAAAPYTYIVGFHAPKDTTFYEYFEVTGKKTTIGMKYIRAYTFE